MLEGFGYEREINGLGDLKGTGVQGTRADPFRDTDDIELVSILSEEGHISAVLTGPSFYTMCIGNFFDDGRVELPGIDSGWDFREPLTRESVMLAALEFGEKERPKFCGEGLMLGGMVSTSEGIFVNSSVRNPDTLKLLLDQAEENNGIYFINKEPISFYGNEIVFVPHELIKQGEQSGREFAASGLARALEHTRNRNAKHLSEIASEELHPGGVIVSGFEPVQDTRLNGISLYSGRQKLVGKLRKGKKKLAIQGGVNAIMRGHLYAIHDTQDYLHAANDK